LVHFDLPWSLMIFQQRNGRVDRYGQKKPPRIVYLFTNTSVASVEQIKGDLRILEILQKKDEQANKNLGDPMSFLRVFDPDKEAAKVAEEMAAGTNPQDFEQKLDQAAAPDQQADGGDWLMNLFSGGDQQTGNATDPVAKAVSFFQSDYDFALTALKTLSRLQPLAQYQADDKARAIHVTAPFGLQERLKTNLPLEVRDPDSSYTLCADRHLVMAAIEAARQAGADEATWPAMHYLWPQHPIIEWLSERVLAAFGRHAAPVIRCARLSTGPAFVMKGLVPNRKGQPLLAEWRVATHGKDGWMLEPFPDFVARAGLKAGALPNPGTVPAIEELKLKAQLPNAVAAMRKYMVTQQKLFATSMSERLAETLDALARLQARQLKQLEQRLVQSKQAKQLNHDKRERRANEIRKVFDEYRQWVEDSMSTEPQPFIQVLAAVVS
jgi:hypothetical protein